MRLTGTTEQIIRAVEDERADVAPALARAQEIVPWSKRQVWPAEAAALYLLACRCNRKDAYILEIGTALGYSAAVMALAAPEATIITLNPKPAEYPRAVEHLAGFEHVYVECATSADYLCAYGGPPLALVFVDGDHSEAGIRSDLAWWQRLEPGGLMLFHDYTPEGSKRACPDVYRVVNEFGTRLGREPDVLVRDDRGVGMAGFYRREVDR